MNELVNQAHRDATGRSLRLVAVLIILGAACSKTERSPSGTSLTPAIRSVATQTAPPANEGAPVAKETNIWAPQVWEQAREAALGEEPSKRRVVQRQVPPPYPDCANHDARILLKAKFGSAFEDRKREAEKQTRSEEAAANQEYEPARVAYEKKGVAFSKAMAGGLFLGAPTALQVASFQAVGHPVSLLQSPAESTELASVRQEMAPRSGAKASFECRLMGVQRVVRTVDSRAGYAGEIAKSENIDLLVCEAAQPSANVRVVIEVPTRMIQAVVKRDGDGATVEKYVKQEEPVAGPQLRKLIDDLLANPSAPIPTQRTVRVTGASQLKWYLHGAPAYAQLKGLGMTGKLAIAAAEYKNVWHIGFKYACADQGLGCTERDGLEPPTVEVVASKDAVAAAAPASPVPTVADGPNPRNLGRWEEAARAAEPTLAASADPAALGQGFFPSLIQNAASLKILVSPGKESPVELATAQSDRFGARFRDELAKLGGPAAFVCDVIDFGQETNPPPLPIVDAALSARGERLDVEAPMYNIACRGDENSYVGSILVYVPTHAAWAVASRDGERATIREYSLQRHAYFSADLKDSLLQLGIGTRLRISNVARLARKGSRLSVHGKWLDGPVWIPLCQRDLRHLASSILLSGARSSESDEIEFRDRGLQLGSA